MLEAIFIAALGALGGAGVWWALRRKQMPIYRTPLGHMTYCYACGTMKPLKGMTQSRRYVGAYCCTRCAGKGK